jgi:signal peptidase I
MRSAIREAIETIALAVFLVLVIQASVQNFRVEGPSMDPRLKNQDRVLVSRVIYTEIDAQRVARFVPGVDAEPNEIWRPFHPPERGDVIVFRWPVDEDQNFVKRVIGVPGDRISVNRGQVILNGEQIDEPYIEHESRETLAEITVSSDSYFVMGDNRAQSDDSRHWGEVADEKVIGKVWVSYWPLDRLAALFSRVP